MHEIALFSSMVSIIVAIFFGRLAFRRHSSSDAILSLFGLIVSIYLVNLYSWLNLPLSNPLQANLRALDYIIAIPMMLLGLQILQTSAEARIKSINRMAKPVTYGTTAILLPVITGLYLVLDQESARQIAVIVAMPTLLVLLLYYFNHLRNNPYRIAKPEFERGTLLVNTGYLVLILSTGVFAGVLRLIDIGIVSILVAVLLVAAGGIVMGTVTFAGLYSKLNLGIIVVSSNGDVEVAKISNDIDDAQNHRVATALIPYMNSALERVMQHCEEVTLPGIALESLSSDRLYQVHIIPHALDSNGMPLSALIIINDITDSAEVLETEQISDLLDRFVRERDAAEFYLDLLSHDMGNIMQGILLGAEMALGSIENQEILETSLDIINDEVDRSMLLIREIKMMVHARETVPKPTRIDTINLLGQSFRTIQHEQPGTVGCISLRTAGQNHYIMAEENLVYCFDSILRYLVTRQPEGGSKIDVLVNSALPDGKTIRIEISDDGQNLPAQEKKQLLQWQTRVTTGGVGLPLAGTLVNRYNGIILIEDNHTSGTGTGLKFVIRFNSAT